MAIKHHFELDQEEYRAWKYVLPPRSVLAFDITTTHDVDVYVMLTDYLQRWKDGERVPLRYYKRGYIITDWLRAGTLGRWSLVVFNPGAVRVEGDAAVRVE